MRPQKPTLQPAAGNHGKPKAAKFSDKHADVATKAAGALQLRVLAVTDPRVADLAAKLPAGRIHANGRGFVPYVRRDLYAKLLEAAGTDQPAGQSAGTNGTSSGAGQPGSPGGQPPRLLPRNWDEIGPGHSVLAQEDDPEDGWYEVYVVDRRGDVLTLKYRDYPRCRRFTAHVFSVALMYPNGQPSADPKAAKPKGSDVTTAAADVGAFPRTWADIAVNSLVLAMQDGPWPAWWEAIPTDQADETFTVRWRDYPQIPNVSRPRQALALLYPNSKK